MSDGVIDFESALISMILDTKDIRTVVNNKINSDYFNDPISKAAFIFLMTWYNNPNYGDTPSWESFSDSFNNFVPNRVEDSIIALCDKLRGKKLYSDIAGLLQEVAEATSGDPHHGFELLKKKTVYLTAAHTVDNTSTIRSSISQLRAEYMAMKEGATGLKGHPYPWDALNHATLGLQDQQLVFLYGRPKTKKTWLLLEIARCLWQHGMRPIIFSQELSDIEIKRRFVALACQVDYDAFSRGKLPEAVERDFLDNLEMFEDSEEVPVSILSSGESCLADLSAKIDEYKANVVLIDGVNYLSTDWKELAEITRGLKRTGQGKRLPIIGSTHANRSRNAKSSSVEDEANDFAYGDSFYQTADLALRITCDIEDRKQQQVKVFTAAIREGKQVLFTVNTKCAQDFTQKSIQRLGEPDNDIDEEIDQDRLDAQSDLPEENV